MEARRGHPARLSTRQGPGRRGRPRPSVLNLFFDERKGVAIQPSVTDALQLPVQQGQCPRTLSTQPTRAGALVEEK